MEKKQNIEKSIHPHAKSCRHTYKMAYQSIFIFTLKGRDAWFRRDHWIRSVCVWSNQCEYNFPLDAEQRSLLSASINNQSINLLTDWLTMDRHYLNLSLSFPDSSTLKCDRSLMTIMSISWTIIHPFIHEFSKYWSTHLHLDLDWLTLTGLPKLTYHPTFFQPDHRVHT